MPEIVHDIDARKDFYGTTLVATYHKNYGHYSFVDEAGKLQGILHDTLNVAAHYLNLSVSYKEPNSENIGIYGKR